MKLASLRTGSRDGTLLVVSRDLGQAASAADIAPNLQAALDDWARVEPALSARSAELNEGRLAGARRFDPKLVESPLPRAYQFLDGSAYLNHVELVRRARGAEMPPSFLDDPLMYQAVSDGFLRPCDDIPAASEDWGIDMEGEVAVVVGDTPMGVSRNEAARYIRLVMLVNDVSLRGLIPGELAKGFGFLVGKPRSSFSPVAVTLDELGGAWDGGKVNLSLIVRLNGNLLGHPNAGLDMNFDFPRLIEHAAQSRPLAAGTIIGSGTVSNRDRSAGSSCLAEVRVIETLEDGEPKTPFMSFGDRVRIEMLDDTGQSIFGAIEQQVARFAPARWS
ncbi:MAG: fumarylacetoacetate hydrolase family protein [Alphaproteobacteria bacterium]